MLEYIAHCVHYVYGGARGRRTHVPPYTEEVGHDVDPSQYHMTLECSLERFWGVAFLVIEAQPAMAMKRALFCLTCVVADNVLECFAKVKAEIAMIQ